MRCAVKTACEYVMGLCRDQRSCALSKSQRLSSVLSLRRPSSRPDSVLRSSASMSHLCPDTGHYADHYAGHSVLRLTASMSHLDTSTGQRHPVDEQPRRTAEYLNVFNSSVRLTISNPDICVPCTATEVARTLLFLPWQIIVIVIQSCCW